MTQIARSGEHVSSALVGCLFVNVDAVSLLHVDHQVPRVGEVLVARAAQEHDVLVADFTYEHRSV